MADPIPHPDENKAWRLDTNNESRNWARSPYPGAEKKYFRRNGFASFQEDKVGCDLAREHDLVNNFLWANDYPHHEETRPHSPQAIERTMGMLDEDERAKILGLNSARIFKFPIPKQYLD